MRLVFVGTGGTGLPFFGVEPPPAATLDADWRLSVAHVLQPNYPDPPTILIDAGPDILHQWAMWRDAPPRPDAVVVSHSHVDHMGGIGMFKFCRPPMRTYGTAETLQRIRLYASAVWPETENFGLASHELTLWQETRIAGIPFTIVPVRHSPTVPSIGLTLRHQGIFLVHLTDTAATIEADVRAVVRRCDVLIVNTPFIEDTTTHIGVASAITFAREVEARRLVLAHISYEADPQALATLTAEHDWITVARRGLVLDF